jgi:alpha-galactosidase
VECLLGDFYPLSAYQLNEELWLAWQFDLPERQKGIVQVFRRASSNYESARFKLRNLDLAATYLVTDLDQPAAPQELSGRELMERGLLISAPEQPSARIITYQASNSGSHSER